MKCNSYKKNKKIFKKIKEKNLPEGETGRFYFLTNNFYVGCFVFSYDKQPRYRIVTKNYNFNSSPGKISPRVLSERLKSLSETIITVSGLPNSLITCLQAPHG